MRGGISVDYARLNRIGDNLFPLPYTTERP